MTTLTAHAPGKVNLCLFVGAPRADGYHPLVSVFQAVSLADELTLEAAPPGAAGDEVVCPGVDGPNLAARALALYREASGWDAPPVRLTILKRVPVAAGMGGGSGDAAAALRLAARAAGLPDDPLVHELAPRLGADVPFALHGGRALVTGIGERVEPLPAGPPQALVVLPSSHALSTPAVYAEADRLGSTRADLAAAEREVRAAVGAAAHDRDGHGRSPRASGRDGGWGALGAGDLPAVNDLQAAAISLCPAVGPALQRLHDAGAGHVLVSGSGPTVFGAFDDPERARAVPGGIVVEPV